MEPMDALKKPGIMAKLRNSKGFSLIEMAIVLVIIGIIIAAIIKGQDLILNARAKQLVATANAWKIAVIAYQDRTGNFPGDSGRNGLIGDTETSAQTAIVDMETANMSNIPANPILIGGNAFWFYLGNATAVGGQPVNVMVICKTVDCAAATVLTTDELELFKAVDTNLDGAAGDGVGNFRSTTKVGYNVAAVTPSAVGGRADGYVTGGVAVTIPTLPTGSTLWTVTANSVAAIWAFDKPF